MNNKEKILKMIKEVIIFLIVGVVFMFIKSRF
ncbi:hypothetical protein C8E03_11486 [Lachnotalea glycerini]|uniref:Uncharacterized protein n=1 Tax=Lachnotalea glycerini TaxID=1763509 RepID=A0A318EHP6_9FIRM|nr:hypothetical protein C8E03_11486 [Lachnotalea glycerini]